VRDGVPSLDCIVLQFVPVYDVLGLSCIVDRSKSSDVLVTIPIEHVADRALNISDADGS